MNTQTKTLTFLRRVTGNVKIAGKIIASITISNISRKPRNGV